MVQFSFQRHRLSVVSGHTKEGRNAEGTFSLKSLNFAFTFHNEPHRHALHTSSRKTAAHFSPQHRRKTKSQHAVEHTTRLLCIHQIQINRARMSNSVQDSCFRDFVKNDTARRSRVQFQNFRKVPRDGFSLAVFIGCQPNGLRLLSCCTKITHHFLFVSRNFVVRLEGFRIHTIVFLI